MKIINIVDIVDSQIIASVKSEKNLDLAMKSGINIVFLLTGNLITTADYIKKYKIIKKRYSFILTLLMVYQILKALLIILLRFGNLMV